MATQYVYPLPKESEKCQMCEKRNGYQDTAGMRVCGKCERAIQETKDY